MNLSLKFFLLFYFSSHKHYQSANRQGSILIFSFFIFILQHPVHSHAGRVNPLGYGTSQWVTLKWLKGCILVIASVAFYFPFMWSSLSAVTSGQPAFCWAARKEPTPSGTARSWVWEFFSEFLRCTTVEARSLKHRQRSNEMPWERKRKTYGLHLINASLCYASSKWSKWTWHRNSASCFF